MTLEQFIGLSLILPMMGLAFLATRFASSARYGGLGLRQIITRAIFRGDVKCRWWLLHNYVYPVSMIIVVCLCITILGLLPKFREGNVYVRPVIVLATSPIMWALIAACYYWFIKKLKHCN